jgi:DNA-binding NarL/FixJ family response regulator
VRLAVADDHGIFRTSLVRALEETGCSVPVSAAGADELLAQLRRHPVEVAIVDVAMPPTRTDEGVRAARVITRDFPGVKVLLLSAETATPQAIALLREFDSGIGYLRKDEVADAVELLEMLERLLSGEQVVGRSVIERLLRSPRRQRTLQTLSDQERRVLSLMAEGRSNAGIARSLRLADRTVEDHVGRIFTKLDLVGAATDGANKRVLAVLTWLRLAPEGSEAP